MAFEYLSGGSVDLFNLIFNQILKISPTVLYKYTTLQDQIIYVLLIPMVILFLFVSAFSKGIVARIVGGGKGFEYLVSIITFIYLIYSGTFGTLLVPIFTAWLQIALALSLFLFAMSIIIHPSRGPQLMKLSEEVGKSAGKLLWEKSRKIKALDREVESLDREIEVYNGQYALAGDNERAKADLRGQIARLKAQRTRLILERDRLG